MTIIVAFILEAFVFRMNYSRKSQDSEGDRRGQLCLICLSVHVSSMAGCRLVSWPVVQGGQPLAVQCIHPAMVF